MALDTLGCKLNQAEAELLAEQFAGAGCRLVPAAYGADIYVLNTCTVTHIADRKSRHLLRLARRRNPGAVIVATGCYAERAPHEIARLADIVVGNKEKPQLVKLLETSGRISPAPALPGPGLRTRSFVRVQDGCNSRCAYCIVPLVRGGDLSVPADRVVAGVREKVSRGNKEVVLTGTEIGGYYHEGVDLSRLLERLLAEGGADRLRLSSLQPQEVSPELVGLWRDRRLCRHFHLSLQSGSDSVLERMGRRYSAGDYRRAVSLIREAVPEAAITTDVIVGFPGETGREFAESCDFCRETGFSRIHVFTYSPRPGTRAAAMPDRVEDGVKRERSQRMLALAEESARDFQRQFLGKTAMVLWEKQSGGVWSGLTGNYIKVYTRSRSELANKLLPVKLVEVYRDGVWGELVCWHH